MSATRKADTLFINEILDSAYSAGTGISLKDNTNIQKEDFTR